MKISNEFCGQKNGFSLSKTLRFELKPIGQTEKKIEEKNLLNNDFKRADAYTEVKNIIDDFHRQFIADILNDVHLDWNNLSNSLLDYQKNSKDKLKKDKLKKELATEQGKMRKAIVEVFTKNKQFSLLFKEDLFKILLPEAIKNDISGLITQKEAALEKFNKFSNYFVGFHENRKNIYTAEEKSTAISYRIVNENFPKYIANLKTFEYLEKEFPQIISKTESELSAFLNGIKLKDIFTINAFNKILSQKGIDFYNTIIGGISDESLTIKKQGLNEAINLARQQLPSDEKNKLKQKMSVLYKQILSDREKVSFIPESFENSEEIYNAINEFSEDILKGTITEIEKLYSQKQIFDLDKIYIPAKELSDFSQRIFGSWSILPQGLFEIQKGTKSLSEKKSVDLSKKIKKSDNSLSELQEAYNKWAEINNIEENNRINILSYFNLPEIHTEKKLDGSYEKESASLISEINEKLKKINFNDIKNLQQEKESSIPLKEYLDAVQNLYHYVRLVDYRGEALKDENFYADYDKILASLSKVVPLYNKVRNFVTKKIGETKKIKLNFDLPTLADGWDENKEQANGAVILRKNNKYFLGILNTKDKPKFQECKDLTQDCYEKMVYKLLPGPNKMLPKVFFSEKGISTFNPPKDILDGYKAGKHKKGDAFDKQFCYKLIDWFKVAINTHTDWKKFAFKFSDTKSYNDISGFYKEVEAQGYKIGFKKVSTIEIDNMVDTGKLFLFQIYNKDFADKSTGKKNMHTLYWENLFSKENLQDIVLKLNGQAELFYRPAVKDMKIITHKKGSILVNRTFVKEVKDGVKEYGTIPEDIYQEIYQYKNGITPTISDEAQKLLNSGKVECRPTTHDITKNKHFTENKYLFHCPISMNFNAAEITGKKFNDRVLNYLKNNSSVKVIGLDRGERHLIYLSLINQKGEIELQKTLNLVNQDRGGNIVQINYQEKLVKNEKDRDNARKNWQTIGNIKELKEGYLSGVVHEIAKMMVNNNAIVVMEDLNFGFKRGRFAVERQVYQKFEQMLIDKLNYLVFKENKPLDDGGVLNAYQLTDKFTAFKDLGKQCGWLFYIPAGYTSKIDPKTGFANLLPMYGLTNVEKKKEFFNKFDSIRYDNDTDSFVFGFDYNKFCENADFKKKWEVYTTGERLVYRPKERRTEEIKPTEMLKDIFTKYAINYENGKTFIDKIKEVQATRENVPFFDILFRAFSATLQMRNSKPNSEIDYLVSPVKARDGTFFDSRVQMELGEIAKLPLDADANGAYHIALKGLYLLKNNFNLNEKGYIESITNASWFKFVQEKEWVK